VIALNAINQSKNKKSQSQQAAGYMKKEIYLFSVLKINRF
jgi:hypothetical protein